MTETEFAETMTALRKLDAEIAALESTKALLRNALADHLGRPAEKAVIDWEDRRITWHPPSKVSTLDRGKLVQAGVTPEQLKAGTVDKPKKGYLDVRKIGSGEQEG